MGQKTGSKIGGFVIKELVSQIVNFVIGLFKKREKVEGTEKHIEDVQKKLDELDNKVAERMKQGPLTEAEKEQIRREKAKLREDLFNGN